jgi:hypothetical protein
MSSHEAEEGDDSAEDEGDSLEVEEDQELND